MVSLDYLKLLVDALGALLVPLVLFFLGQWYLRAKEHSESALRDAQQLQAFLEHLSSDRRDRRKLALLALVHMRDAGLFPRELLQAVESIAATDDPEMAAFAQVALGSARPNATLDATARALLLELLLPMKIQFERSRHAFERWIREPPTRPNVEIEDAIKDSNVTILNLLRKKWVLIPQSLQDDALRLMAHYDAWLAEYERLRPGGVRDQSVPWVFVGPDGFPFPKQAEVRFLRTYDEMTNAARDGG